MSASPALSTAASNASRNALGTRRPRCQKPLSRVVPHLLERLTNASMACVVSIGGSHRLDHLIKSLLLGAVGDVELLAGLREVCNSARTASDGSPNVSLARSLLAGARRDSCDVTGHRVLRAAAFKGAFGRIDLTRRSGGGIGALGGDAGDK